MNVALEAGGKRDVSGNIVPKDTRRVHDGGTSLVNLKVIERDTGLGESGGKRVGFGGGEVGFLKAQNVRR